MAVRLSEGERNAKGMMALERSCVNKDDSPSIRNKTITNINR